MSNDVMGEGGRPKTEDGSRESLVRGFFIKET